VHSNAGGEHELLEMRDFDGWWAVGREAGWRLFSRSQACVAARIPARLIDSDRDSCSA